MPNGFLQQKNSLGRTNESVLKTAGASSVIGAIGGTVSGYFSASSSKKALSYQQEALRNQAQIKILENQRRQRYMNESSAARYWQLGDERDEAISTQKMAASSQGFSGTQPTDQSIYFDTLNKYTQAQNDVSRDLQLNSFESNISTASQVSSLISGANIAGIQKDNISQIMSAAAGGISGFVVPSDVNPGLRVLLGE